MEEETVAGNVNVRKKSNKKFIIGFSIFLTLLVILTIVALYFTFQYIDKQNRERLEQYEAEKNKQTYQEAIKKEAEDKIYGITSYAETYDENSIIIKEIEDYDVNYFEIDGLKNTQIQKKINDRIKNTAYSFNKKNVYTYVTANFSNVLSLVFYGDDERIKTLNIDLTTGEDIPLSKVFVSSAPFNLYLSEGLYKALAFNDIDYEDDNWEKNLNMDNRDTSEYEDKFLKIIRKYEKNKDNIVYSIDTNKVSIYELGKDILKSDMSIDIDLIDYPQDVAIYKRYLTDESIYKDDKLGAKGVIVFTDNSLYREENNMFTSLYYGKLTDNIFMEEFVENYDNEYKSKKVIKDFIDKLSKDKKVDIKKKVKSTQGAIYQVQYIISTREEGYYDINVFSSIATCSTQCFKNEAFREFAKMKAISTGEASIRVFNEFNSTNDLKIEEERKQYFISFEGELLGNTQEEVDAKLNAINEPQDEQNNQQPNPEANEMQEENNESKNNPVKDQENSNIIPT